MTVSTTSSATVLGGPSSVADSRGLGDEPKNGHSDYSHDITLTIIELQ